MNYEFNSHWIPACAGMIVEKSPLSSKERVRERSGGLPFSTGFHPWLIFLNHFVVLWILRWSLRMTTYKKQWQVWNLPLRK
jgi:hypothetical protein